MASWLILVVGAVYAYIATEMFFTGRLPMALTFAGYAFSNIGLWLAARSGT